MTSILPPCLDEIEEKMLEALPSRVRVDLPVLPLKSGPLRDVVRICASVAEGLLVQHHVKVDLHKCSCLPCCDRRLSVDPPECSAGGEHAWVLSMGTRDSICSRCGASVPATGHVAR